MKRVKKQIGSNATIEQAGIIDKPLLVSPLSPKDNHANQDKRGGNDIPDEVHPIDALTAAKPFVAIFSDVFMHVFTNHGTASR